AGVEVGIATGVGDHHHLDRTSRPLDLIGEGGGVGDQGTHSDQSRKEGGAECFFHWNTPGWDRSRASQSRPRLGRFGSYCQPGTRYCMAMASSRAPLATFL